MDAGLGNAIVASETGKVFRSECAALNSATTTAYTLRGYLFLFWQQLIVDDVEYNLEIVDTAGQEEFASFRDSSIDYGVQASPRYFDLSVFRPLWELNGFHSSRRTHSLLWLSFEPMHT